MLKLGYKIALICALVLIPTVSYAVTGVTIQPSDGSSDIIRFLTNTGTVIGKLTSLGLGSWNGTHTFNAGIVVKNSSNNAFTIKNSGGGIIDSIDSSGIGTWNGTQVFNAGICSGATYCITNDHHNGFYEINGSSNKIILGPVTNASQVIEDALLNLNKTRQTYSSNGNNTINGGTVYIQSGVYPITHEITLPINGNITVIGDGIGTILQVPSPNTNNVFAYRNNSTTGFGYIFKDLFLRGWGHVTACGPCTGFYFQSTVGPKDVYWDKVWVTNFGQYGFYFGQVWNYNIHNVVCEFSVSHCIFSFRGSDLKIEESKCLDNVGNSCALIESQVVTINNNFFQGNQKRGLWIANPAANIVISNNHFLQNSQSSNNGFPDLDLSTIVNHILVVSNSFAGNNASPRASYGVVVGSGDHDILISNNDFQSIQADTYASGKISQVAGITNMTTTNNIYYNPFNKITNWNDGNTMIDPFGANGTVSNKTYTINNMPIFIRCTGGTSPTYTIKDGAGNTVFQNATTLSAPIPLGFKLTVSTTAGTPTCNVFGN